MAKLFFMINTVKFLLEENIKEIENIVGNLLIIVEIILGKSNLIKMV